MSSFIDSNSGGLTFLSVGNNKSPAVSHLLSEEKCKKVMEKPFITHSTKPRKSIFE
jgi:hypothetical protein